VNKSELTDLVASKVGLDKRSASSAVDAVVGGVMGAVRSGDKVLIMGFGSFNPTARAARMGRNPQTGAPVKIAATTGVRFAPGAAFKSLLNSKGGSANAASTRKAPANRPPSRPGRSKGTPKS
jgi:DNA-binding protein HU-beta